MVLTRITMMFTPVKMFVQILAHGTNVYLPVSFGGVYR